MSAEDPRSRPTYSVVVPTIGRPSLRRLVDALRTGAGPAPVELVVVDDRADPSTPLDALDPTDDGGDGGDGERPQAAASAWASPIVLRSGGRGPAAARNTGWRATTASWVAFLDDDVVPGPAWAEELGADLDGLARVVAGSQGRLRVPLPPDRRPTDWERNVAGLETARWATADLAYRRDVLVEVGGFDERFGRAFREDADLGLRVTAAGYVIVQGERTVEHPVRPAGRAVSIRLQAGNADDVLMRARWGPGWRIAAGAERGRTGRHLLTTAAAVTAAIGVITRRRPAAALGATVWTAATAELVAARVGPGPRTADEVATMVATSLVLPGAATGHLLRGLASLRHTLRDDRRAPLGLARSPLALEPPRLRSAHRPRTRLADPAWQPAAILFDRDGTLIVDTPGNADPAAIRLMPGARVAVLRAREAGLAVGVVTNQAVIGRGTRTRAEVDAMNQRVDEMVGPFDTWRICPHTPEDGCRCRKPAPGLVLGAAADLGVDPRCCAVVGDILTDTGAAGAAGARSVLVPTVHTRPDEITRAPAVARDLLQAVDYVLAGLC